MRVTQFTVFNQLTRAFQKNVKELSDLYNKLSSGKKMDKPSDDVIGVAKAMDYKISINENEQYKRNIDEAESQLNFTDTTLSSVTGILTRVRELAIEGANGSQSAESRASIAKEVAALNDQLMSLANSKLLDRYIFSGFKTGAASFDSNFIYQGDTGLINVKIEKNANIAVNITGDKAFSVNGITFFKTLDDLNNALENNIVDGQQGGPPGIRDAITSLDNALGQVTNVRADIGARLGYLENQKSRIEDNILSQKTVLSNTEDTDITETVSEVSKTEVALEALRQSGAKILSQSLLDFLG